MRRAVIIGKILFLVLQSLTSFRVYIDHMGELTWVLVIVSKFYFIGFSWDGHLDDEIPSSCCQLRGIFIIELAFSPGGDWM